MKKRVLAILMLLCMIFGAMGSVALPAYAVEAAANRVILQKGNRSGVWFEKSLEAEGDLLEVPSEFEGFEVEYATYEGERYLPEEEISLHEAEEVLYFLKGSYYSAADVKAHPDEAIYTIGTAAELAALAELTAEGYDFDNATLYITADLDFSDYETWTPIGHVNSQSGGTADENSYPFRGNLNGQFYRFENIDMDLNGKFQSIFGYVEGATFENIILAEGEMRSTGYRLGALASLFKSGKARNIESHLSLYSDASDQNLNMGLFALTHGVTIERVAVYGTIGDPDLKTQQQNGGISGCGYDTNTTIKYSFVPAKINGTQVFQIGQRCIIENCPLVGSEEMPFADFIGGKAAWILNTAGGTAENSGLWTNGAGGPTLMGNTAVYRQESIAITEAGDEIATTYDYYENGQGLNLSAPEGYTLKEVKDENTNLVSAEQKMPRKDQTLYLICAPKTYAIQYELGGATAEKELVENHRAGAETILPAGDAVKKEGYVFGGWYEREDFSGKALAAIPADFHRNLILYAKWLSPSVITTADQLCAIGNGDLAGAYVLGADIDLTDKDFAPIGAVNAPFTGSFDGNGYTISGLTIESNKNYQGLFGYNEGYICNVTLAEDCSIKGNNYVGAIAGFNGGSISGCITAADVGGAASTSSAKQYSLMSQNLCVWGNQYDIEAVSTRQPWMVQRIEAQNTDFLGFQECSPTWVDYLTTNLSDTYTFMYKYREPTVSSSSESSMVGFKTADFDLLNSGYFWLSETPDVCSKGWDAGHWRICHWMYLQDKENGQKIGIFNTHFDLTDTSKLGAAHVIHSRMVAALEANPDMAILACGDFNSEETTAPYPVLTSDGFLDARYASPITTDEYTHTKGAGWGDGTRSIDYIFGHEERVIFDEFDVLNELSSTGKRLSDHNGVLARFRTMSGHYVGGAVGANDGAVDFIFARGSASGTASVGAVVGENKGEVNRFYISADDLLDYVGEGEGPEIKDNEYYYDYEDLYFLWRINREADGVAFTLVNGGLALRGNRDREIPVRVSIGEDSTFHLSGEQYNIDTEGFSDPICLVNGEYIEGASFALPKKDCAVSVMENSSCQAHAYGRWSALDEEQHQRICAENPSHIEKGDHNWGTPQIVGADCTKKGYTLKVCSDCGYALYLYDEEAAGHGYGSWAPYDAQEHYRICQKNAAHLEYLPHDFDSGISFEATCEEGAGTLYTCSACGYEKKEYSSLPLGHLYGSVEIGDESAHQRVCARDEEHLLLLAHQMKIEEHQDGAHFICLDCGYEDRPENCELDGHDFGEWEDLNGMMHIRTCKRDPSHQETKVHDYDDGTYFAASCTVDEHTHYECATCHYSYDVRGDELAFGHSFGDWALKKEASSTESGRYERVCDTCEEIEVRVIPCDQDPAIVAVIKELEEGGKVAIDLVLQNNPGIAGLGLEIHYDAEDLSPDAENPVVMGEALSGMMIIENIDREGEKIVLTGVKTSNVTKNGVIATLYFDMQDTFGSKSLLGLKVQPQNTIDEDLARVVLYDRDLLIELEHCRHHFIWNQEEGAYICGLDGCEKRWSCAGDADGDGRLTTADAILIMRHLINGLSIDEVLADFNGDGAVRISDAVMILRFLSDNISA